MDWIIDNWIVWWLGPVCLFLSLVSCISSMMFSLGPELSRDMSKPLSTRKARWTVVKYEVLTVCCKVACKGFGVAGIVLTFALVVSTMGWVVQFIINF